MCPDTAAFELKGQALGNTNLTFFIQINEDIREQYKNGTLEESTLKTLITNTYANGRPITQYFNPKTWNYYGYSDYISVA